MNSGNDIIDLTLDDTPPAGAATAANLNNRQQHHNGPAPLGAAAGKRVRSSTCAKATAASRKKVKAEKLASSSSSIQNNDENINNNHNSNSNSNSELDVDDEIEILNAGQISTLQFVGPPSTSVTTTAGMNNSNGDDDDDIQVVGTVGHVRLPHLRQDCTEHPFSNAAAAGAIFGYHIQSGNGNCCDMCYCYVCDKPASECSQRQQAGGHSNASNTIVFWRNQRQLYKENPNHPALGAAAAEEEEDDGEDDDDQDEYDILEKGWEEMMASFLGNRASTTPRALGPGPFSPDDALAKQDETLTPCRLCGYYNRFAHENFRLGRTQQNRVGVSDWCQACGRIASSKDFDKQQGRVYTPKPGDIFLGNKIIPFRLHAHDPRKMSKYQAQWERHPEWIYNDLDMQQDLFLHRLGKHPTLHAILASIPVLEESKIPTDGSNDHNARISLLETDAVLVAPCDLHILYAIKLASPNFAIFSSSAMMEANKFMDGDLTATWNDHAGTGTLTVRVYLKNLDSQPSTPSNISKFFGTWFGVYPLPLSQVCGLLEPEEQPESQVQDPHYVRVSTPPFTFSADERFDLQEDYIDSQEQAISDILNNRPSISLQRGQGMLEGSGGLCTNETDFAGIMKRFAREILPDVVDAFNRHDLTGGFQSWIEYNTLSRVSGHRSFCQASLSLDLVDVLTDRSSSIISNAELALHAPVLSKSSKAAVDKASSIESVLGHLVNLGHAAAPFVDGLTVELLPFQLQSIQWALERETVPGGIQSYWCTQLPIVKQPDTDIYYNPIIAKVSKSKPALVRGGIMAEQMGLGKTVITLALILKNPAPLAPPSGTPSSELTALVGASSSATSFWDPEMKIPGTNKKRGSILCRGTLVVCNVSLVGQWIEEAKSKLTNPGVIYSYHGSSRKRDAVTLAQNSVVVTTYETLSSDATFHKNKSSDEDYCPPCEQIRWWRIICDEAHVLRKSSNKSDAVLSIPADHKWLVSGTPINTSINDLSNQLKFLGIQDFTLMMNQFKQNVCNTGTKSRWRYAHDHPTPAIGVFSFLMRSVMMRHTQSMKYANTATTLMSLPALTETTVLVPFSTQDQEEYKAMESPLQSFYKNLKQSLKGKPIGRNYMLLTQKLMPLRIACSGGRVPIESAGTADTGIENYDDDSKMTKKPQAFSEYAFTSKVSKLIQELNRCRDEDPTSKSLVFSQYKSTLQWLQQELPRHGYQFRTLSGDMSVAKRSKALRDFQNDPPTSVFLLSMRAGAVGINLTQANRVFIMEPCFNPAIESQAIGRVYRLGQTRPVEIIRLIMQDSVESRIRTMLENKYGQRAPPLLSPWATRSQLLAAMRMLSSDACKPKRTRSLKASLTCCTA